MGKGQLVRGEDKAGLAKPHKDRTPGSSGQLFDFKKPAMTCLLEVNIATTSSTFNCASPGLRR
jgi:hypothetical protein